MSDKENSSSEASLTVVIPVFNGGSTLEMLCDRLALTLPKTAVNYEVVFVNDGSRDNSWRLIERLSERYSWVRGINLMRNYGQHNALLCGVRAATGDVIVTMDDDLQHPPEEIPRLVAALTTELDVVYGKPVRERHGLLRDLASRVTKWTLSLVMGAKAAGDVTAFRAFRTKLRDGFVDYRGAFISLDALLTWSTSRFGAIQVNHLPRAAGHSGYSARKLFTIAFNLITAFSVVPLQLASLLGFICTLFGLALLVYVLGKYFIIGGTLKGFTFLASTIVIFSGAQLIALGIIGEYIARMHFRLLDKPSYAIRETTHHNGNP